MKKNLTEALKSKDGGVKKQYEEYMPEGKTQYDELSVEEQYEIILKITSDGKGAPNDTKIINKVASVFAKQNPKTDGLDVKKNLQVVNLHCVEGHGEEQAPAQEKDEGDHDCHCVLGPVRVSLIVKHTHLFLRLLLVNHRHCDAKD